MELLTYIVNFAFESPQNGLIVVGFVGFFGWFAPPISTAPVKRTKRTNKGHKKTKRTKRTNTSVKVKNRKTQWTKMHIPDAAEIYRVEEMFRRARG